LILDSFRLAGKNALVTGSSRGMGAAIAIALAEAGANVALHASRSVPADVIAQVAAIGVRPVALTADLTNPELAPALVEQTIAALGSIDILINNAGITRRAPAVDFALSDWDDVLATDLTSVFRLCQCAGRAMLAQGSGKIVNIASLLSFQGGITVPAYAAAKGGHRARLRGHGPDAGFAGRRHTHAADPRAHSGRTLGLTGGRCGSRGLPVLSRQQLHQRTHPRCRWRLAGALSLLFNPVRRIDCRFIRNGVR